MANREKTKTVTDFTFWAPKSLQMVTSAMKLKDVCFLEVKLHQPRQRIKKQRHYFETNVLLVKALVFLVVRYGLERKLSARELMLSTVVLEKTLENPLDSKEIQPVHPKGNQS